MIQFDRVSKHLGDGGIFDLSFSLEQGQSLAILGPKEAGKSTILRILLGLFRADKGKAEILNMDCFLKRAEIMKHLSYATISPWLPENLNGEEYLSFHKQYYGLMNPDKLARYQEKLGIELTARCSRLSAADRQKLALLPVLARDTDILLLDDVFTALNRFDKNALTDILRERKAAGLTLLLATHILEEAQVICDTTLLIREGRMVLKKDMEKMKLTRQKVYHITFADTREAADFVREWEGAELIGNQAMVAIPASPEYLIKTLARYSVIDLVGGREDSEASFLEACGGDLA